MPIAASTLIYLALIWLLVNARIPLPGVALFPLLAVPQVIIHMRYGAAGGGLLLLSSTFIGALACAARLGRLDGALFALETAWLWFLFYKLDDVLDRYRTLAHEQVEEVERGEWLLSLLNEKEKNLKHQLEGLKQRLANYRLLQKFTNELARGLKVEETRDMVEKTVQSLTNAPRVAMAVFPAPNAPETEDRLGQWMVKHKLPLVIPPKTQDFRFGPADRDRRIVSVPLGGGGTISGTLTVWKNAGEGEHDSDQDLLRFIGDVSSVASLAVTNAQLFEKIEALATQDSLTGLYVRYLFDEKIAEEFSRSRLWHVPFSLILFDIDHFKNVNDTRGHSAGDAVLKAVSRIIREQTREADFVYRYGGEEIAVLLPHTKAKDVTQRAEEIRRKIESAAMVWENQKFNVTISGGVAEYAPFMEKPSDMIGAADQALYQAKKSGRNRIVVNGADA